MAARDKLKDRLFDKSSQLPAQISLRCVSAISICSVVGTGVFISTLSTSLRVSARLFMQDLQFIDNGRQEAGPAGTLIAYALTSSIVYCTAVSNGEMMAHLPSIGGPVGLADVFVDPALGFAMGWNAWYHWSIIIPTQLSAAGRLAKTYISSSPTSDSTSLYYASIAFFLVLAVGVNFTGAKRFGQIHVVFAVLKMTTLVAVVLVALVIDWSSVPLFNAFPTGSTCNTMNILTPTVANISSTCPALSSHDLSSGQVRILGKYWTCPGPWVQPFGTTGNWGSILGVFTVLIQAAFSFFGTEIAGVPGREIKDPATNIPRAIRRVWFRITVLYLLAVIAAGLVVPSNHPCLNSAPSVDGSPWIIALTTAYASKIPRYTLSALFMVSAFSAASADVYVSSRYLFFLARRGHAPEVFGSLYKSKQKALLPFRNPDDHDIEMRERPRTSLHPHVLPTTPPRPTHSHYREPSSLSLMSPASPNSPSSPTSELGLLLPHGHSRQLSNSFSLPHPSPHSRPNTSHSTSGPIITVSSEPMIHASGSVSRPQTAPTVQSGQTLTLRAPTPMPMHASQSAPASLYSPTPNSPQTAPRRLKRAATIMNAPPPEVVVPWVGVLFAGAIGLLVFMAPAGQNNQAVSNSFKFLTQMTNCAALVSWVGILVTYLRFYKGTLYWEKKDTAFRQTHAETLYKNRTWGQPYLAWYALLWCIAILLGQGWSSFTLPGVKRIAETFGEPMIVQDPGSDFAFAFIVSYLPVAAFLLLAFGYKLVYQTRFVDLEDMNFTGRERRSTRATQPRRPEDPPRNVWESIYRVLL
ncbi:hypothetical protein EXIGLDRAFT_834293 [Exidia glandulosa HHB12029]|uniref:Amino acid permease/ SLC12A domain-containing protein n=1 Tax=Exidia glandulosa HHB12029 TaxID=1314781 RepID=A0A166AV72_EXIGL|nr:hypothetical protein EXIGLDRAFT_834293 [Exidia glandulosa HHB12029]